MEGQVVSVSRDDAHRFSKAQTDQIRLIAGLGVEGDAHAGVTVQHRSRVAADPSQPNLRQVHVLHAELLDELAGAGFEVEPGQLGENVTTRGIDLLGLPRGALLSIGQSAVVEVTGLRNPCAQIEAFRSGLLKAVVDEGADGRPILKAGIMGVVVADGVVWSGDAIRVEMPSGPYRALERV